MLVAIVGVLVAWKTDLSLADIRTFASKVADKVADHLTPGHPSAPLDTTRAAFDKAESDAQAQLATLRKPTIDGDEAERSMDAADSDISNGRAFLVELRTRAPEQKATWKTLENKLNADEEQLWGLPLDIRLPPGIHEIDIWRAKYDEAKHKFAKEIDAGEDILQNKSPNTGALDLDALDKLDGHFLAALKAITSQNTAIGRLRRIASAHVDVWDNDGHDVDAEIDRLMGDWNTVEKHDRSEATAPYQD